MVMRAATACALVSSSAASKVWSCACRHHQDPSIAHWIVCVRDIIAIRPATRPFLQLISLVIVQVTRLPVDSTTRVRLPTASRV